VGPGTRSARSVKRTPHSYPVVASSGKTMRSVFWRMQMSRMTSDMRTRFS